MGMAPPITGRDPMTIRNDIIDLAATLKGETLTEMVKTWANCLEAEIDERGEIWIAGPMTGHWLKEAALREFMAWMGEQDLDDWQDRCNPKWAAAKK